MCAPLPPPHGYCSEPQRVTLHTAAPGVARGRWEPLVKVVLTWPARKKDIPPIHKIRHDGWTHVRSQYVGMLRQAASYDAAAAAVVFLQQPEAFKTRYSGNTRTQHETEAAFDKWERSLKTGGARETEQVGASRTHRGGGGRHMSYCMRIKCGH